MQVEAWHAALYVCVDAEAFYCSSSSLPSTIRTELKFQTQRGKEKHPISAKINTTL
jgi:hypothetical protein